MRLGNITLAFVMASVTVGQQIILPPGPLTPGSTIPVTLVNNTGAPMGFQVGNPLWMQHPDGGVIIFPSVADYTVPFPPGATMMVSLAVPAQGPGSNGSFVLRWRTTALRIDVGAPSASFPAIHTNPTWIAFGGHFATNPSPFGIAWEASNTGSTAHTFGAGDTVRIYSPGGTFPLVTASLAGVTVPPQGSMSAALPIAGLSPGHYTVEMVWTDPATNAITSARHGMRDSVPAGVDTSLPGGHVIPIGGVLPAHLRLALFSSLTPYYAFCVGISPGTTPAPGGDVFPLVYDAAVAASLADGIGGLLTANVGLATPAFAQVYGLGWSAAGIGITHPGIPYSGLTVRCAAIGYDPSQGIFAFSQGEDLLIQ